ncbi:hypothetical protein C2857_005141 [Epichloe festucae Fl1]|uniref:5-hydroxyisourate hydrolase n=1 Tax=Epichloe festucae (strain Fl1) TaxID=877507 RepID=A0A7U3Q174_EPIFF|nr:hypothetical protein C2857_005141 [Epichloe festucae Fl1]
MEAKDPITCHILDTTAGCPAMGVRVRLEGGSSSAYVFTSSTDEDGRITVWPPRSSDPGRVPAHTLHHVLGEMDGASTWTLRFDTAGYFGDRNTFFPEAVVVFRVEKGQHYHVPLLFSPYSYTTYRGS